MIFMLVRELEKWKDILTDRQTNACMDKWVKERIKGWING
jgi:hypothetical protein